MSPLLKGKRNIGRNISEFHKGKTYKRTAKKFGKKRANAQAIAVGINSSKRTSTGFRKGAMKQERM